MYPHHDTDKFYDDADAAGFKAVEQVADAPTLRRSNGVQDRFIHDSARFNRESSRLNLTILIVDCVGSVDTRI
jgi:hypothetical protein